MNALSVGQASVPLLICQSYISAMPWQEHTGLARHIEIGHRLAGASQLRTPAHRLFQKVVVSHSLHGTLCVPMVVCP